MDIFSHVELTKELRVYMYPYVCVFYYINKLIYQYMISRLHVDHLVGKLVFYTPKSLLQIFCTVLQIYIHVLSTCTCIYSVLIYS